MQQNILNEVSVEDKAAWLKLCFTHPLCQQLMNATALKEELLNGFIDAHSLYQSFVDEDIETLGVLLFQNGPRKFTLFVASYEKKTPVFFAYTGKDERHLFLTEQTAQEKTSNASYVKSWLRVKVELNAMMFKELCDTKMLRYQQAIPKEAIVDDSLKTMEHSVCFH